MNRFLPLISCAFVGILVSSCARNPPSVVPKPAYGSTSGTPHRSAKHHHVALAQVPLRHPRPASEGHRRLLSPWNYPAPANAAMPHTDHLPTDPNASTPPNKETDLRISNRLLSPRTRAMTGQLLCDHERARPWRSARASCVWWACLQEPFASPLVVPSSPRTPHPWVTFTQAASP